MTDSAWPLTRLRVAIRGGGDLGSGVAYRLHQAGFSLLISELAQPRLVRRAVSFGSAVVEETITVERITAHRVIDLQQAHHIQQEDHIPVVVDPDGEMIQTYDPSLVVDARMFKREAERPPFRPPLLIGLGPGFNAPDNCDMVIETSRGHNLGRIISKGAAEPHTHIPGTVGGKDKERVLRASVDGTLTGLAQIGDQLKTGDPIARIGDTTIEAPFDGVLRGLIHNATPVTIGMKIGDLDARARREYCFTISDKSLAIGGAVLHAILASPIIRQIIMEQNR